LTTSTTDPNVEKLTEIATDGHQLTERKYKKCCAKILGCKQNNEKEICSTLSTRLLE
jgi:hypothetical protein